MKRDDDIYYYHTNHLGSTMSMSQHEGKLQERVEFDVYGMPSFFDVEGKVMTGSYIDNNVLFTGREYDAESNNYYFRARMQHPDIGRFMQKDPLMYVDGMNDYAYVNNGAVRYIDASGNKRNPVVDFLFGGCLDLPKNWKCAENAWQKAGAVGLCGLDVAGLIPAAGVAAKGAKGAAMAGKAAKAAKAADKTDNVIDASKAFRNDGKTPKVEPVSPIRKDPSKNPNPKQPEKQPTPPSPTPTPPPSKPSNPFSPDPNVNPLTPAKPIHPGKEWISKAA
ncbi:MAG: hypothetical protein J6U52_01805 [Alistipes sp.]|nr:hypothetical protein [Alistipes sp.]